MPYHSEITTIDHPPMLTIDPRQLFLPKPQLNHAGYITELGGHDDRTGSQHSRWSGPSLPPSTSYAPRRSNPAGSSPPCYASEVSTPSLTGSSPTTSTRASPIPLYVYNGNSDLNEKPAFAQDLSRFGPTSPTNGSAATSSQSPPGSSGRCARSRNKQRYEPYESPSARPKILSEPSERSFQWRGDAIYAKINRRVGLGDDVEDTECACGVKLVGTRGKHWVMDHIWVDLPPIVKSTNSKIRFVCPLQGCDTPMQWNARHRHIRKNHLLIGGNVCEFCSSVFQSSRKESIERHCETMHGVKKERPKSVDKN
ncbi:hypothetical protein OBBRIDRAFT_834755 [Obba rivulosa]|uniref:Uncharacterized protein n=1 Tax=Obba rivulosa TaxID=1052685 RepID=A0A8E2AYY2_9APHY|nr:hypothetical protein OBBRIDRAFT_834755 [Obba rivulosa]